MPSQRLNAREIQYALKLVLEKAQTQIAAERGALAAAISITIVRRGPVGAVDALRDLADLIERDAVLPVGEVLQ